MVYLAQFPVGGGEERGTFASLSSSASKGLFSRETRGDRRIRSVCNRTSGFNLLAAIQPVSGIGKESTKLRVTAVAGLAVHVARSPRAAGTASRRPQPEARGAAAVSFALGAIAGTAD